MFDSARAAARGLSVIGFAASGFTALSTLLPGPAGLDRAGVAFVCLATALSALVMRAAFWGRLPLRVTLVMVPVALALIAVHNSVGAVDPFRYGVFYLLLFVWIGMYHRPGTALVAGLPTLVSYAAPLVAGGQLAQLSTAVYAVPMYVVVGEVIARRSTALGEARNRLHALAHSDALTGLPNRRAFLDAVASALPGPGGDVPAIAFLDLDRFKDVNDRLGHAAGDALLQAVAKAVTSVSRAGDLAARLAGDEFAVLLCGPLSPAEAEAIGRRLEAAVAEAGQRVAPGVGVRASVGVAWCSDEAERALDRADAAMYRSKRIGGGTVLAEPGFAPVASV